MFDIQSVKLIMLYLSLHFIVQWFQTHCVLAQIKTQGQQWLMMHWSVTGRTDYSVVYSHGCLQSIMLFYSYHLGHSGSSEIKHCGLLYKVNSIWRHHFLFSHKSIPPCHLHPCVLPLFGSVWQSISPSFWATELVGFHQGPINPQNDSLKALRK